MFARISRTGAGWSTSVVFVYCTSTELIRPCRKNPTSVMFDERASSTARLEGAETAMTIGIPAISAFCTISKEVRPLTIRA